MTEAEHESTQVIVALVDELEREALQRLSVYIIEKLNKDKNLGHKSGNC